MGEGERVMTDIPNTKYCPGCEREKDKAEFYQNRKCYRDGLSSHCKVCQCADSKKSYERGRREPKSTRRARTVLAAAGIPCTTGKAAGYAWVDLAAWGCIPIEAKGCTIKDHNGNQKVLWAFSHKQQREGFEDGFFVFMAWFKDDQLPMRSFIVPTSEKWIMNHTWSRRYGWAKEGQPKRGLGLVMNSRLGGELWPQFSMFEDRFDLIEQRRIEMATRLVVIEPDEYRSSRPPFSVAMQETWDTLPLFQGVTA